MICDICGANVSPDDLANRSTPCRDGQSVELRVCRKCEDDHPAFREGASAAQSRASVTADFH